ncbi:MAG: UPF0179 family protein [Euryarchaeota archaeon]|nr:UPF0179 family protein [Euryarchaeota archaeon]
MTLVTLIGEKLAKEDEEFIYLGPNNDCRRCKLKTVCFNLKPGRRYKIIDIRDKRHSCELHEGNAAVVEVQELPIIAAIDKELTEGSTARIERKECKNIGCDNFELCNNLALQKDRNYKITKIYEGLDCPIGHELQKAELAD